MSRMTRLGRSLRARVVAAMVVPALIGLFVAGLVFSRLAAGYQRSSTIEKKTAETRAIAQLVRRGAGPSTLRAVQQILGDDQLVVVEHGKVTFSGPTNPESPHLPIGVSVPGGQVRLISDLDSTTLFSAQLTAVAGMLIVLLGVSAATGTWLLSRHIRRPIERAITVADRVAGGDLSARMGPSGPEEFRRMSRAFDGMAARLESADRERREFLTDLAHELVTPLNAIGGIATAALDGTITTAPDRAQACDLVDGELDRVRGLLDDVRELGFLDLTTSGRSELVDLAVVCHRVAGRFGTVAVQAGVGLAVQARPTEVMSDQRLVETVLDNLLSNAIRHTPSGGQVDVVLRRRSDNLVVAVRDTGVGIAREHHDRIFERLYRVDVARDRSRGGSGLGLAIARRAAVALGGRLELDSTPGTGSEFRLVLPLRTRPSAATTEGAQEGPQW